MYPEISAYGRSADTKSANTGFMGKFTVPVH